MCGAQCRSKSKLERENKYSQADRRKFIVVVELCRAHPDAACSTQVCCSCSFVARVRS